MQASSLINSTFVYMNNGISKSASSRSPTRLSLFILLLSRRQLRELFTQVGPPLLKALAVAAHLTHAVTEAVLAAALAASHVAPGLINQVSDLECAVSGNSVITSLRPCIHRLSNRDPSLKSGKLTRPSRIRLGSAMLEPASRKKMNDGSILEGKE